MGANEMKSVKYVLITGASGFLGRNLCVALERYEGIEVLPFDIGNAETDLPAMVGKADFIVHLAGVNRPRDERDYVTVNVGLTRHLCEIAEAKLHPPPILFSSSTQVELDNPYGRSKRMAEEILTAYSRRSRAPVFIYRFPNLFGKWARPYYNSVVATFCYNAARRLPLEISDPKRMVVFAYVDDVVKECIARILETGTAPTDGVPCFCQVTQTYTVTLGQLSALVKSFRAVRDGAPMPDLSDPFVRKLYATFVSYYDSASLAYPVVLRTDSRGWLFELIKSENFGQIFVSLTRPGVVRGNHAHNTKVEKFCVIHGHGVIRLRHMATGERVELSVSGEDIRIVDIPPGYTHSIENTGDCDMITLFWASEVFDPSRPDTFPEMV